MVTTTVENEEQESTVDGAEVTNEQNVQELQQGDDESGAESKDAKESATDLTLTAEILLHPFNTSLQALWLCETLKQQLKAEVLYLMGSPVGTVIKISIRTPVSLVEFLSGMEQVAEAWEENASHSGNGGPLPGMASQQPANPSKEPDKVVCVALKPV